MTTTAAEAPKRKLPPIVDVVDPAPAPANGKPAAAALAPPKFVASQLLPIDSIEADPHNPRKDFPKEQMNELISSVMLLGVRQPIEVRVVGSGKHRIVAGERRWRAAKAAGLKEIPATVRTMTDLEAAEVQLAENLKRADLSPLEVAGGYQRQLELGRSIDQVCERSGKKRSAVYATLQLLQLGDAGRKALGEERISTSVAQLVARVPKALQEQALSVVEGGQWQRPLTFKQAELELGKVFVVDLKKAPWELKDESIPCVAKSCAVCPKRTGNAPDLFPDAKSPDGCSDPVAYRQKLYAHAKAGVEKAGLKLLKPEQAPAEKLFWNGGRGGVNNESGYVDVGDRCYDDTQNRTYKELLTPEQRKKLTLVALDADGKQRQLYERAGLLREVKKGGLIKTRKVGKTTTTRTTTRSAEPKHYREPPPDIDEVVDRAAKAKLVETVEKKGLTPALLKQILISAIGKSESFGEHRALKDFSPWRLTEKTFDKYFPKASQGAQHGMLYEATVLDDAFCYGRRDSVDGLLRENGIDPKKHRAEVMKANPILWSEDSKGATGSGVKNGAEYLIEKKGKAFVFKKPKDAGELTFDTLEKAKATAAKVETGAAVWKAEEANVTPSLKDLISGKSDTVSKAVKKHASKKAAATKKGK